MGHGHRNTQSYVLTYCTKGDYNQENLSLIKVGIFYDDLQGIECYEEIFLRVAVYIELLEGPEKMAVKYIIEEL